MKKAKRALGLVVLVIVISIVYPSSGSQKKTEPNRPSVQEIHDKFSQTIANYKSFIIKIDYSSREINDKIKRPVTRYGSSEVRYDGNKIKTRNSSWGQVSLDMYVPKSSPTYNSVFWDGQERYQYSKGSKVVEKNPANLAGFVMISHEKKRDFETSGLALNLGSFTGDVDRIDLRFLQDKSTKLLDKMERVGNSNCYVIEADTKYGKYKIWFDSEHGYNIAQAVLERRPGDIEQQNNSVVDPRLWTRKELRNVKFEKVGEVWVPMSGETQTDI